MMLAALLASLAFAGADQPVCHGQLGGTRRESRLESAIRFRRDLGLPHGPAYVRRVQRTGRKDRELGLALTRREWRYMRERDRLQNAGAAIARYLSRRPRLSGGMSIEDDFPRGAYFLVRVTRERARHLRALRRLSRFRVRAVEVKHSYRALRRAQRRIDFDAHAADGFQLVHTSPDIDRNRVVIGLITRRTDHTEYFVARYGPLVVTEVVATEPTRPDCTTLFGYEVLGNGRTLRLAYEAGGGAEFERVELSEHDDRVEVGVVVRVPNGVRTAESRRALHDVTLRAPLGDRTVIDAATDRRVRRCSGPSCDGG